MTALRTEKLAAILHFNQNMKYAFVILALAFSFHLTAEDQQSDDIPREPNAIPSVGRGDYERCAGMEKDDAEKFNAYLACVKQATGPRGAAAQNAEGNAIVTAGDVVAPSPNSGADIFTNGTLAPPPAPAAAPQQAPTSSNPIANNQQSPAICPAGQNPNPPYNCF